MLHLEAANLLCLFQGFAKTTVMPVNFEPDNLANVIILCMEIK